MLFGEVHRVKTDGNELKIPWAAHAVVRRVSEGERQEWKMSRYRVWL